MSIWYSTIKSAFIRISPIAVFAGVFIWLCGTVFALPDNWREIANKVQEDSIIRVEASVEESPARIKLIFLDPGKYIIYRKPLDAIDGWGKPIATTPDAAKEWTDEKVKVGQPYEYLIRIDADKPTCNPATHKIKRGYIAAGIRVDQTGERGKVIVAVDKTILKPLAMEIERLKKDLVGDGWEVIMLEVKRADPTKADPALPQKIKKQIKEIYDADPKNVKQLLLLGHVPTVRSGLAGMTPDGHQTGGAFAADSYYAELDGNWTDKGTFATKNKPGDGKFDQTNLPSPVELGFGRVDMHGISIVEGKTEIDLLRNYLDKEHRFRHAAEDFRPGRKCLLRQGHGHVNYHARQGFTALVGGDNVVEITRSELPKPPEEKILKKNEENEKKGKGKKKSNRKKNPKNWDGDLEYSNLHGPFLFYAKGGGVPNSRAFAEKGSKALCWFGWQSGWGFWQGKNNVMRTSLGSDGMTLLMFWMTRARYPLHLLSMGGPAGDFFKRTINNMPHSQCLYPFPLVPRNTGRKLEGRVLMNLIGNPTLRLFPVIPPSNAKAVRNGEKVKITWNASADANITGYLVYCSASELGPYKEINNVNFLVKKPEFIIPKPVADEKYYMIRAIKLDTSAGGTFLNPSQGIFVKLEK